MSTPLGASGTTTFKARAEIEISASPEQVYNTVSALERSGEWSVECIGGAWVHGRPATAGAIFRGDNVRSTGVVAWAPVIRGNWTTESEVLEAEPARVFRWSVLNRDRGRQESVWSFEMEPNGEGGTRLTHHYWLGELTEGLAKIFEGLEEEERRRFVAEWNDKLAEDIRSTVERIKIVIEKD